MLSSIPSKPNSILDKLINEEGDRGAAPTSMASAAAAASMNTMHVLLSRVRNTERRALKQMFEPKCASACTSSSSSASASSSATILAIFPYCDMETGRGEVTRACRWTAALTMHAQT